MLKKIIDEISKPMLIGCVAVLMFNIVANLTYTKSDGTEVKGVFNVIGVAAEIKVTDYSTYTNSDSVKNHALRKNPEITVVDGFRFIKNQEIQLLNYFNVKFDGEADKPATDVSGLIITDITDVAGNSILDRYADNKISFENAENYIITFYIADTMNKESTIKIKIPVNSR